MRNAMLAFMLALSASCATSQTPPTETAVNGYAQVLERVDRNVHVMRQALPNFAGVVGNVVIIEQARGFVIVDSGSSRGDGEAVVEAIRSINARKPVTAIVITHWHNDHPLGLPALAAAWPQAEIIAVENTHIRLEDGQTNVPMAPDAAWDAQRVQTLEGYLPGIRESINDQSLSQAERDGWARAAAAIPLRVTRAPGTHVVLPTRTFTDRLVLDDPRVPVEVRFEGRANTDGDALIWLPRQRIVATGDIVVAPVPYNFSIYPSDNIQTLQRLQDMNYAVLIPGHGEVQRDRAFVDLLIAFNRDVRDQVAALVREGRTLEEINAQLTMPEYAQRFAGDDAWVRLWFRNYSLEPLIASANTEARGEPLGNPLRRATN